MELRSTAPDEIAGLARRLARCGHAEEARETWRQASNAYLASGRPLQAIAAALESGGPRAHATDAALEVARRIVPPVERASGQQILCEVEQPVREALVDRFHPLSYDGDTVVAREGDPAEAVWFVVRGTLRAERRGPLGARLAAGVAGPGSVVGESAVLTGSRRLVTLVTEGRTDLLELRRSD